MNENENNGLFDDKNKKVGDDSASNEPSLDNRPIQENPEDSPKANSDGVNTNLNNTTNANPGAFQNSYQNNYQRQQPQQYSNTYNSSGYYNQQPITNTSSNQQQTQWSYDENNAMGKPKKKEKSKKNKGLKVFAIIMTILFLASAVTVGYYLANDGGQNGSKKGIEQNGTTPKLDIEDAPKGEQKDTIDESGRLTTQAVNKIVNPSVVAIVTYTKSAGYQQLGTGSGVIMSEDGYIVTNAHVVQSDDKSYTVDKIEVILDTKESYTAELIGADTKTDLAVLKINGNGLKAATFGDSSKLEVGETVIVIGNPSGVSFAGSLTQGVVSALDRQVQMSLTDQSMRYIQTDAAINPGNSGGALSNQYGQVIGINSAKIVQEGFEGMGFAIPINSAKPVIDSIIENGYVKGRVKIGIQYLPVTETLAKLNGIPRGLRVVEFDPQADIAKKGIQKGDIITRIGELEVYDAATITEAIKGKKPGDTIDITVYRVGEDGKAMTTTMTVALGEDAPAK